MTDSQRELMEHAFHTTSDAAQHLGVSPRTVNRWMSGASPIPRTALVTAAVYAHQAIYRDLFDKSNLFNEGNTVGTIAEETLRQWEYSLIVCRKILLMART